MLWSDFERFLDPWREFERMRRALLGINGMTATDFPAVNIWVGPDNAVVTTEVPGIDPDDIDISVVDRSLTLRGVRQPEESKEEASYHRRERWSGRFSRTIELPFAVEADKVAARFKKGVLTIDLPRAESDKPRRITVTSN